MELIIRITAKDIQYNLVNLRKLVIEITDSYNLMCTYWASVQIKYDTS